MTNYYLI